MTKVVQKVTAAKAVVKAAATKDVKKTVKAAASAVAPKAAKMSAPKTKKAASKKAMVKAKKSKSKKKSVSMIAKGRGAKALVFKGLKMSTSGGLKKEDLVENRAGRIVSKRRSEAAKKTYLKNGLD